MAPGRAIWAVFALLMLFCAVLGLAAASPALAGTSVSAVQTVTDPAGFSVVVPTAWHAGPAAPSGTLKEWLVSSDGKETLRVSAAAQTIQSGDVAMFVAVYLGNIAGSNPDLGSPRTLAVPGADGAAAQTLRYTDSSGSRMAETVVAATTGTTLYVLDISSPDSYAVQNSALLDMIVSSLQVGSGGSR